MPMASRKEILFFSKKIRHIKWWFRYNHKRWLLKFSPVFYYALLLTSLIESVKLNQFTSVRRIWHAWRGLPPTGYDGMVERWRDKGACLQPALFLPRATETSHVPWACFPTSACNLCLTKVDSAVCYGYRSLWAKCHHRLNQTDGLAWHRTHIVLEEVG